jgi:hypothetical protein
MVLLHPVPEVVAVTSKLPPDPRKLVANVYAAESIGNPVTVSTPAAVSHVKESPEIRVLGILIPPAWRRQHRCQGFF